MGHKNYRLIKANDKATKKKNNNNNKKSTKNPPR